MMSNWHACGVDDIACPLPHANTRLRVDDGDRPPVLVPNPVLCAGYFHRALLGQFSQAPKPHDHGIRNGSVQMLGWQTAGANSRPIPCWLTVKAEEMLELTMLDTTFPGGRPTTSGQHLQWETLFIRVRPPEALYII